MTTNNWGRMFHSQQHAELHTKIINTIDDLVGRFTYYDRKEDEELPVGALEDAVRAGVITVDEMVSRFRDSLRKDVL